MANTTQTKFQSARLRLMNSVPPMPKQSWSSAAVDLVMLLAIVFLAMWPYTQERAWWVMSQIAFARFGVGMWKRNQDNAGGGGSGVSGGYQRVNLPEVTPERPAGQPGDKPDNTRRTLAGALLGKLVMMTNAWRSPLNTPFLAPPLVLGVVCLTVAVSSLLHF